jgi:hypothetical protein
VRLAVFLGLLALAAVLGALAIGHGLLLPGIAAAPLVDPNLARALMGPLSLRLAEVLVGGSLVLVCTTPRWISSRVATTAALLLAGAALAHRWLLLPHLGRLWSRVDLVAARPVDTLAEAQRWTQHQNTLLLCMALLALLIAALAARPTTR